MKWGILIPGREPEKSPELRQTPYSSMGIGEVYLWITDECPADQECFELNRFQKGIVYWFLPKRRWYTHSELESILHKHRQK